MPLRRNLGGSLTDERVGGFFAIPSVVIRRLVRIEEVERPDGVVTD